jgi:hypothetical protein
MTRRGSQRILMCKYIEAPINLKHHESKKETYI